MALRILIVDDHQDRALALRQSLPAEVYDIVGQVDGTADLRGILEATPADVIIASLSSPDRDTLEHMRLASHRNPKPIVMFVDQAGAGMAAEAVRAGVSAYIVDGLSPTRLTPIVEIAIARFGEFNKLRQEVERSRTALADRKIIDRAKGMVMQQRGIGEPAAYALLRSTAMRQNQRLVDVARNLLAVADLLMDPSEPDE